MGTHDGSKSRYQRVSTLDTVEKTGGKLWEKSIL